MDLHRAERVNEQPGDRAERHVYVTTEAFGSGVSQLFAFEGPG